MRVRKYMKTLQKIFRAFSVGANEHKSLHELCTNFTLILHSLTRINTFKARISVRQEVMSPRFLANFFLKSECGTRNP